MSLPTMETMSKYGIFANTSDFLQYLNIYRHGASPSYSRVYPEPNEGECPQCQRYGAHNAHTQMMLECANCSNVFKNKLHCMNNIE